MEQVFALTYAGRFSHIEDMLAPERHWQLSRLIQQQKRESDALEKARKKR